MFNFHGLTKKTIAVSFERVSNLIPFSTKYTITFLIHSSMEGKCESADLSGSTLIFHQCLVYSCDSQVLYTVAVFEEGTSRNLQYLQLLPIMDSSLTK